MPKHDRKEPNKQKPTPGASKNKTTAILKEHSKMLLRKYAGVVADHKKCTVHNLALPFSKCPSGTILVAQATWHAMT
jgi:hypothetical protein